MHNLSCDLSRKPISTERHSDIQLAIVRKLVRQFSRTTMCSTKSAFQPGEELGHCVTSEREENADNKKKGAIWCDEETGARMLYTVNQVATDHLQVSRATVYRLIRNGEIKAVKIRGCTRISLHEISLYEASLGDAR